MPSQSDVTPCVAIVSMVIRFGCLNGNLQVWLSCSTMWESGESFSLRVFNNVVFAEVDHRKMHTHAHCYQNLGHCFYCVGEVCWGSLLLFILRVWHMTRTTAFVPRTCMICQIMRINKYALCMCMHFYNILQWMIIQVWPEYQTWMWDLSIWILCVDFRAMWKLIKDSRPQAWDWIENLRT